jgi:hypothetical protein
MKEKSVSLSSSSSFCKYVYIRKERFIVVASQRPHTPGEPSKERKQAKEKTENQKKKPQKTHIWQRRSTRSSSSSSRSNRTCCPSSVAVPSRSEVHAFEQRGHCFFRCLFAVFLVVRDGEDDTQ